jgi:hypothetical protein
MTKKLQTLFCSLIFISQIFAQSTSETETKVASISSYYKLAIQYKNGNGVPMDYKLAFENFSKAAALGDPQSIYAIEYMSYKGLGCLQDYKKAADLFYKGAIIEKDNSMYFYGLCLRNGYGVVKNEDSAKYWLNKAAALGYKQATLELKMTVGENANDSANALVAQINNAAIPLNTTLNKFNKVQQKLASSEVISGEYTGWIIQYDWSGEHAVSSKRLKLNLGARDNNLSGKWIEDVNNSIDITATLASDSVIFKNTQYRRKDHYSPDSAILYNFGKARLNLVQTKDSVFLAGNLEMFSPQRGEPSKPLFIALSRKLPPVKKLVAKVYPNPFSNVLNVSFNLLESTKIEVQLITLTGTILYRNTAGQLEPGWYMLPIPTENTTPGFYLVKLLYTDGSTVLKAVKL